MTKPIPLRDFAIYAQFNPRRIGSTTAKVDKTSIAQRPCFLCARNLPPEEKGLAYGEDLIIFCNPFPILENHLTIVHREHIEQSIAGYFESMLDLARDLSSKFFVLYNGPQCGASAPDHLHFQACSRNCLPLIEHLETIEHADQLSASKQTVVQTESCEILALPGYHLNTLIYRGSDRERLTRWFDRSLDILTSLTSKQPEPLINLLVTYDKPEWSVVLFPRAKHRPTCYYEEGARHLMVSPATIDLAGCLVVPLEEHFHRIDAEAVHQIFSEVTLEAKVFSDLIETINEDARQRSPSARSTKTL